MGLIGFILALYVISSVCDALESISAVVAPLAGSRIGVLITAAVTAWLTYRWYRAHHASGTASRKTGRNAQAPSGRNSAPQAPVYDTEPLKYHGSGTRP